MAPIKIGDKWGIINEKNEFILTPTYEYQFYYSEGLALVKLNGKYETGWGKIAQNSKGHNGMYTRALLENLKKGSTLEEVLQSTAIKVKN